MDTMNYSEARQNLAAALDLAAKGQPVTITRRGHKPAVISKVWMILFAGGNALISHFPRPYF